MQNTMFFVRAKELPRVFSLRRFNRIGTNESGYVVKYDLIDQSIEAS